MVREHPHPRQARPPGIAARPLDTISRHTVKFEIMWHVNTNTAVVEAFTERPETALAGRSSPESLTR